MNDPDVKYVSGTLPDGRSFAQWWLAVKLYGLVSEECVAQVYERDGRFGLNVTPEASAGILHLALTAKSELEQGRSVAATHAVTWTFGKPTFTEVEA